MPLPTIPLDYVAEVLNESGKRFYISEYIWSKNGGKCKYRKGEETYEEDANKFVHEKFSKYNWWHNKHSTYWGFVEGTNIETFEIEWNRITIDVKINHFGYCLQKNGGSHHHAYEYQVRGYNTSFVRLERQECKQHTYLKTLNPDHEIPTYNNIYTVEEKTPLPTTRTGYFSSHILKRDASEYIKANELRDYILSELGEPPAQGDLFT
jgi:hypothetical protein